MCAHSSTVHLEHAQGLALLVALCGWDALRPLLSATLPLQSCLCFQLHRPEERDD